MVNKEIAEMYLFRFFMVDTKKHEIIREGTVFAKSTNQANLKVTLSPTEAKNENLYIKFIQILNYKI